jgi:hypothetical protein
MMATFPFALSYALRVNWALRLIPKPSQRKKWTARIALGLAIFGALGSTLYAVLQLFFPFE